MSALAGILCALGVHARIPAGCQCHGAFADDHYRCRRCGGLWSLLTTGFAGQPDAMWQRVR
jgi:hypothetical protein